MEEIKIGENYTYLKDACKVKVLSQKEDIPEMPEHNIYQVKALEACDLLDIKEGDEFPVIDNELD